MADELKSNVTINIGIKKSADEVSDLIKSIDRLEKILEAMSKKPYKIDIEITGDIEGKAKQIANELRNLTHQQAAFIGPEQVEQNVQRVEAALGKLKDLYGRVQDQRKEIEVKNASHVAGTKTEIPLTDLRVQSPTSTEVSSTVKNVTVGKGDEQETIEVNLSTQVAETKELKDNFLEVTRQTSKYKDGLRESATLTRKVVDVENEINIALEKRTRTKEKLKAQNEAEEQQRRRELRRSSEEQVQRLLDKGFTKDPTKSRDVMDIHGNKIGSIATYTKELKNGMIIMREIDEVNGKMVDKEKENLKVKRDLVAAGKELLAISQKTNETLERKRNLEAYRKDMQAQGFTMMPSSFSRTGTGELQETIRGFKASKVGLFDMNVQIAEYNQKMNKFTVRTKTGADAIRFLGDGLLTAGRKVLIWTVSTTALFAAIRTIKELTSEIKELESNTVFLSRVSDRLVSGIEDETLAMKRKMAIAESITNQTVELNAEIGDIATNAQRAASVFLRAGQTEEETMYGVAASLLAVKIAELEVDESSQFLVSTLLQFNLRAKELIPTLDTLNTLSNNYSVTTQDLFDSISRAGAIYAEQNGTVSELASMTAIAAETTKRSGSQIGNAFKTVISRLNSLEVRNKLFEELSFNTVNFQGESKSLMETLFQLSLVIDKLSEAEKKELFIKIAGVRQANILIASMNEVDRAVIAHAKALEDSGSAYEEYKETAKTLESAIGRLHGQFTLLSNEFREPMGEGMESVVLIATQLLKVLVSISRYIGSSNITNISAFAGLVLMLKLLTSRLGTVGKAFASLNLITHDYIATKNRAISVIKNYTASLNTSETMAYRAGKATGALINVVKSLATVQNAAAVATYMYVQSVINEAKNEQAVISLLEKQTAIQDAETASAKKKREALTSVNARINELYASTVRLKDLLSKEDEGSERYKTLEERIESARKRIVEFAKAIKIDTSDLNDLTSLDSIKKINERIAQEQRRQLKVETDAVKQKEQARSKEIETLKKEMQLRKAAIKDQRVVISRGHSLGDQQQLEVLKIDMENLAGVMEKINKARLEGEKNPGFFGIGKYTRIAGADEFNKNYERYLELQAQIQEKEKELAATREEAKELKIADVDPEQMVRMSNLSIHLFEISQAIDDMQSKYERDSAIETSLYGKKSPQTILERIRQTRTDLEDAAKTIRELRASDLGSDETILKRYIDQAKALREELGKLVPEYEALVFKTTVGYEEEMNKMRDAFQLEIELTSKRLNLKKKTTAEAIKIQELETKAMIITAQVRESKANLEKSNRRGDGITAESERVRLQRLLNQLKDTEYQKQMEILALERKVADARVKSYEDASKKAAELEFADKARLLAQANYLANNPGEIGFMTQFNRMNPDQVKMLREFFPGRAGDIDPNGSAIERILARAGIGSSKEAALAQKEYLEILSGKTQISISDESLARMAKILAEETFLESGVEVRDSSVNKQGSIIQNSPVNNLIIQEGAFSLKPFTQEFKSLMTTIIQREVANISKELSNIDYTGSTEPRRRE